MENSILCKNSQPTSYILADNNKLQDTYNSMKELHLNKGRGFGIYAANDLLLLKSNTEYERFLTKQYGSDEIHQGKTLKEIGSSLDHISLFENVLKSGKAFFQNNFKHITYNNEDLFLDITLIPIYNQNKKLIFIVESFTDVTQIEKQKEFFTYICHEFKTPLTIILSALQAIKLICKDDLSATSLKYLGKIHQGALQQWRLVTQLLDMLKSDSAYLKLKEKNLDIIKTTKSICNAVSVYATTKGITLNFSSTINEQIIGIDDEKYERILLNLLSNAIKFTPPGNAVNVKVDLEGDTIKVAVKDSGIGIPKDEISSIFDLYSRLDNSLTRKTEGTGIGLHLVKELTSAIKGTITVKSIVGKGSSFILNLPTKKTKKEVFDTTCYNLTENHLVEMTNVEFSNVYFE